MDLNDVFLSIICFQLVLIDLIHNFDLKSVLSNLLNFQNDVEPISNSNSFKLSKNKTWR
jgi:hypothetical protein